MIKKILNKLLIVPVLVVLSTYGWSQSPVIMSPQILRSDSASRVPFTIQGATGQSANLTEWKSSTGTVLCSMSAAGALSCAGGGSTTTLSGTEPRLILTETDQGADAKTWDVEVSGSIFKIRTRTDVDGAGNTALAITRSGTTITGMGINTEAPATDFHIVSTSAASPRGLTVDQVTSSALGGRFECRKARVGPTIIVTADVLCQMDGWGYDGANYLLMGQISMNSTGTIAATRVPTTMTFATATDAAPSVLATALTLGADQSATFASSLSATTGVFSGAVTTSGLQTGTGAVTANVFISSVHTTNGSIGWEITNGNSGTAALATVSVIANSGNGGLVAYGGGFTTSGAAIQDGVRLFSNSTSSGGLMMGTIGANATMLSTNNAVRLTITGAGALTFDSTMVSPAATGTRYLCISTAGVVTSSAAVCSGT